MSYLDLEGKRFLVFGVANRRSVAYHIGMGLEREGAIVIYAVHSEERKESLNKLLEGRQIEVCDVEQSKEIEALSRKLWDEEKMLDGIVHSIAFLNYENGPVPFHETKREDFLQAAQISAFSLVEIAGVFKPQLKKDASVIAISISSTTITAESYGIMSPIKSALNGIVSYLAKSFSRDTAIRFNAVGAGPLKTNSSAGIPGYMDNYLFAEQCTFRKEALKTEEVADTALFLLSPRSSGINGSTVTVDAGLGMNTFDADIVKRAMRPETNN